jgi:hypothetical protein
MNWTNVYRLPRPLEEAIKEDLYFGKRQSQLDKYLKENNLDPRTTTHLSVSDLIGPPRKRQLIRRHEAEIQKDVSMEIFRVLGNAVHGLLRDHAYKAESEGVDSYNAEERIFVHLKVRNRVVVISGEPDLVTMDGVIHDYKVVAVWGWLKGIKTEWEQQVNLYALLRSMVGRVTTGLKITFILRDWSANETMQEGYPKAGAQCMDVTMWDLEKIRTYLYGRISLHLDSEGEYDDDLVECTSEEMWEKPESWAVRKTKSQRATKVFRGDLSSTALIEATADAARRNSTVGKGKEEYVVEHRPGERTRCERFCDASPFCSAYKEYRAVAFRGAEALT